MAAAVVLTNQFGAPVGRKRTNLPHFRAEINLSGLKLELKFQLPDFQILNANLHAATRIPKPTVPSNRFAYKPMNHKELARLKLRCDNSRLLLAGNTPQDRLQG